VIEQEDYSFAVPKKDLASHVQVLLQQRRLKIARSLPDAEMLVSELQTFRVKPSLSAAKRSTPGAKAPTTTWCWPSRWRAGGPNVRCPGATMRLRAAERA
jgi:hypothetical protein